MSDLGEWRSGMGIFLTAVKSVKRDERVWGERSYGFTSITQRSQQTGERSKRVRAGQVISHWT
jgi:hypothetical protein